MRVGGWRGALPHFQDTRGSHPSSPTRGGEQPQTAGRGLCPSHAPGLSEGPSPPLLYQRVSSNCSTCSSSKEWNSAGRKPGRAWQGVGRVPAEGAAQLQPAWAPRSHPTVVSRSLTTRAPAALRCPAPWAGGDPVPGPQPPRGPGPVLRVTCPEAPGGQHAPAAEASPAAARSNRGLHVRCLE